MNATTYRKIVITITGILAVLGIWFGQQEVKNAVECHATADKMNVKSDYVPGSGCWLSDTGADGDWKHLTGS